MKQPHNISTCTTTQMSPQFHKECSKGTHNCSTKLLTSDGSFPHLYYHMPESTGSTSQHHLQFLPPHCPVSLSSPTPSFPSRWLHLCYTCPISAVPFVLLHESHCHQGNFFPSKPLTSSLSYLLRTAELLKASFRPLHLLLQAGKQDSFWNVGVMFNTLQDK